MLLELVLSASMVPATIYGMKGDGGRYERMCGDPGKAVECGPGAITASGAAFHPDEPHVAVHAPKRMRLRKGKLVCFLHKNGKEVWLPLSDKKGRQGFDISKAGVLKLGYTPTRWWSAKLELCATPIKEI